MFFAGGRAGLNPTTVSRAAVGYQIGLICASDFDEYDDKQFMCLLLVL
jgi:hypothetical protein